MHLLTLDDPPHLEEYLLNHLDSILPPERQFTEQDTQIWIQAFASDLNVLREYVYESTLTPIEFIQEKQDKASNYFRQIISQKVPFQTCLEELHDFVLAMVLGGGVLPSSWVQNRTRLEVLDALLEENIVRWRGSDDNDYDHHLYSENNNNNNNNNNNTNPTHHHDHDGRQIVWWSGVVGAGAEGWFRENGDENLAKNGQYKKEYI